MERKDLEAKLRAIQDLKAERYIGTQQAWQYLKAVESVYKNPKKISDEINDYLQKRLGEGKVYYPATEERLIGLANILEELFEKIEEDEDKKIMSNYNPRSSKALDEVHYLIIFHDSIAQERGYKTWHEMMLKEYPLRDISSQFIFIPPDAMDIKVELLEYFNKEMDAALDGLGHIFSLNQNLKMNNKLFGDNVLEYIKENYFFVFPEQAHITIETIVSDTNLDYVLSNINLKKLRARAMRGAFSKISTFVRIQKILRDQVENKMDIMREIVSDFLYENEYNSYEEALAISKEKLRIRQKRLKNLIRLSAPPPIIDSEVSSLKILEYEVRCLVSERNFVERYLREGKK